MRKIIRRTSVLLVALFLGFQGNAGCNEVKRPSSDEQKKGEGPAATGSSDTKTPALSRSSQRPIHRSPIAGSWYPDNPEKLRSLLEDYLRKARGVPPSQAADLISLIVPHAGFAYSGQTAAYAYRVLQQRKPRRVIFIGPSHYARFHGVSAGAFRAYVTPLGEVPVDDRAVEILSGCPLVRFHPDAHKREHCLDIQVPFLQVLFPQSPPLIVPLLVGSLKEEDYPVLAQCLRPLLDKDTVVVVSSDFTHYGPRFQYVPFPRNASVAENIEKLDNGASSQILRLNRKGFIAYEEETGITICGWRPIALLLELLPRDTRPERLFYDTSGRLTGDFENSVSYCSLAFFNPSLWGSRTKSKRIEPGEHADMKKSNPSSERTKPARDTLSESERAILLRLARDTVNEYVKHRKKPDARGESYAISPRLEEPRGAFVTLKKNGKLRGCIGYIQPVESLYKTVQENAVNAATRDTRFAPVKPKELEQIEIEISALTPPERISSAEEIILGKHGIILEKGGHRAVFLPQVAPEQGWNLEETLRHLSHKAGLSPDTWQDPDTRFSVFTAEVFEEHQPGGRD